MLLDELANEALAFAAGRRCEVRLFRNMDQATHFEYTSAVSKVLIPRS